MKQSAKKLKWIKQNDKIGAALICWYGGMEGGSAVADILSGDVNPSGKLTDTFANDYYDYYPVYKTITTSRYYYYAANGTNTSMTKTTTDYKCDTIIPTTTNVEIPETGFSTRSSRSRIGGPRRGRTSPLKSSHGTDAASPSTPLRAS